MTTLSITPGATGDWLITVTDASGAPMSLAALTSAWFTVKAHLYDLDPGVVQLALGSGLSVVSVSAGTIRALATPAQTASLVSLRRAWWDCRLKFADGTVSNPENLSGELVIEPRVTTAN